MKKILFFAATLLVIAGGLVYWGSSFAAQTVSEQLSAQKIQFPDKATLEKSGETSLIKYASAKVDTGVEAKAYSEFIQGHVDKIANGKTYSEVSALSRNDPTNLALKGQVDTIFKGQTLRGLLLNAWGWGLIGTIALYSSYALIGAAILLYVIALYPGTKKSTKKSRSR